MSDYSPTGTNGRVLIRRTNRDGTPFSQYKKCQACRQRVHVSEMKAHQAQHKGAK